jgi:hypothetical protein
MSGRFWQDWHGSGSRASRQQTLLDRDDPLDAHELLKRPAAPHDVFREGAAHLVEGELAHLLDGDRDDHPAGNDPYGGDWQDDPDD